MGLIDGKALKMVIILIVILAIFFASAFTLLVFAGTLGVTSISTGAIYGKFKPYSKNMNGYFQHGRFDLKHYLFNWIMQLFGISKVQDEAVPHESPFVCPMGEVKEFIPLRDQKKFFGAVHKAKPPDPSLIKPDDDVDKTFYYYPTFGTMNRDSADGSRDNGIYGSNGTIFHVMHLTPASYATHWHGRPVTVTVYHNTVQIRTTLRGKCVSKVSQIPAPLNSLCETAIHDFPGLQPPYAFNQYIKEQYPPAPFGDPIVGTEGWIKENLGKPTFKSDLKKLAEEKKKAKEYEWYSMRLAFVSGKIGASKEDNPFLDNNGWGVNGGKRLEVQERFTETFRFYPADMKHVTVGKAYKFGTVLGVIRDSGISTVTVTFEQTKKEAEENDMSGALAAAKEFYKLLKERSQSCYNNPYVANYTGDCCELAGNVVIAKIKCSAIIALEMLGYADDQIQKMLRFTNFIDDYYPYPVFFELYVTSRGVSLTKGSSEADNKPKDIYVDFYKKDVARRTEDQKTEFQDTFVNPLDFMVPFTTIQDPNQNLHGFSQEGGE